MNTDVVIKSSMDLKVGGAFRLSIHKNNTVTFRALGASAQLVFPAHTAAILSPKPDHTVVLAESGHLTFTFNSAAPGNYCVLTLPMHVKVPDSVPCDQTGATGATFLVKGRTSRPTPQDGTETQPVIDDPPPPPPSDGITS